MCNGICTVIQGVQDGLQCVGAGFGAGVRHIDRVIKNPDGFDGIVRGIANAVLVANVLQYGERAVPSIVTTMYEFRKIFGAARVFDQVHYFTGGALCADFQNNKLPMIAANATFLFARLGSIVQLFAEHNLIQDVSRDMLPEQFAEILAGMKRAPLIDFSLIAGMTILAGYRLKALYDGQWGAHEAWSCVSLAADIASIAIGVGVAKALSSSMPILRVSYGTFVTALSMVAAVTAVIAVLVGPEGSGGGSGNPGVNGAENIYV